MDKRTDKKQTDKKQAGSIISRFAKLSIKKKIQYVAILLVIVVILAIYFTSFGRSETPEETSSVQTQTQTADTNSVEARLMDTLSRIDGAGRVEVMITYESSAEIVPAISVDTQTSTTTDESENGSSTTTSENTQSEIVTVSGSSGNNALVLRENCPEVKGVLVIAEGADDIGVKLDLLNAVQTILSVGPDKVDVYKMNNE